MYKTKAIASNSLSIVENHNQLFEQIRRAQTADDMRSIMEDVRQFIARYKNADKESVNRIHARFMAKLGEMIEENALIHEHMFKRANEIRGQAYDFEWEKDESQAVQSKLLHLMAQLPKVKTTANENMVSRIIKDTADSGFIGSRAVLELLKIPAYAGMVSEWLKGKAFEGSKTPAQQAFDRLKEAHLRQVEKPHADVIMQGFHLRKIEQKAGTLNQPSHWGAHG